MPLFKPKDGFSPVRYKPNWVIALPREWPIIQFKTKLVLMGAVAFQLEQSLLLEFVNADFNDGASVVSVVPATELYETAKTEAWVAVAAKQDLVVDGWAVKVRDDHGEVCWTVMRWHLKLFPSSEVYWTYGMFV